MVNALGRNGEQKIGSYSIKNCTIVNVMRKSPNVAQNKHTRGSVIPWLPFAIAEDL